MSTPDGTQRARVVVELARSIPEPEGRPVCVALDGMTGVGKTSLRGELATQLRHEGRKVLEASGDDFHHPREHRYTQGRESALGYYEDAYDYVAMARKLLAPLGEGGSREVRMRHHDLVSDAILTEEPLVTVEPSTVVLVDGSFLMRPEVAPLWDLHILVEASRIASVARQSARDGSPEDPGHPYYGRYFGAYDIYVERCNPRSRATFVVNNTDLKRPVVVISR